MKKILFIIVFTNVIVSGIAAQDRFPDLRAYADIFSEIIGYGTNWRNAELRITDNPEANALHSGLGGNLNFLDTPLEIAIAAYVLYTADQLNSAAEAILPHSNTRLVDRQLGAYVYMDMIIHRFLGDTAAVSRHEAMLQFITSRGNVTRAEVEAYYRNGIRALVSDIVDEQVARLRNERRIIPNANALSNIKNALTEFMLAASEATYRNLLLTYQRGRGDADNSALVLGLAVGEINAEISIALANNRILGQR